MNSIMKELRKLMDLAKATGENVCVINIPQNSSHSSQIQHMSRIDVLKSFSNFYHLIKSMREVFPENFSLIAQFSLTVWLFNVLGIAQKFLVCNFI